MQYKGLRGNHTEKRKRNKEKKGRQESEGLLRRKGKGDECLRRDF